MEMVNRSVMPMAKRGGPPGRLVCATKTVITVTVGPWDDITGHKADGLQRPLVPRPASRHANTRQVSANCPMSGASRRTRRKRLASAIS